MTEPTFRALVVRETPDGRFARQVETMTVEDLPPDEVLIEVHYSSLNYKDALSAVGNRGVTKKYPHTPGVDAAGVVAASDADRFSPGQEVIVTGYDLGMNTHGGWSEYIRVPAGWVVQRPTSLTLREAMIFGTAGFAASLSVQRLLTQGLSQDGDRVLVTGASGGVGSIACGVLAHLGHNVTAATGKSEAIQRLEKLGVDEFVGRNEVNDDSTRPLLKARWAGVVDTVGGDVLATVIRQTHYRGAITSCGNAAGGELHLTVYPFILRGLTLLGVDSAQSPMEMRLALWNQMAGPYKFDQLDLLAQEITLDDLDEEIDRMLSGGGWGRKVVRLK
jgi:putative YhdH/YhfP family quinone oxidoreductase